MQNTKFEKDKLKKVLYDNLNMLFDKLEQKNQDLDELEIQLKKGGQRGKK